MTNTKSEWTSSVVPRHESIHLKHVASIAAQFLDSEGVFHLLIQLMIENEEPNPAGSAQYLMDTYKANFRIKRR